MEGNALRRKQCTRSFPRAEEQSCPSRPVDRSYRNPLPGVHGDDVCLSINAPEDHMILLGEFLDVC